MSNPFFLNHGPFDILDILKLIGISDKKDYSQNQVFDIKDLVTATNKDITFFHTNKYKDIAKNTSLSQIIPKHLFV